MNNVGSSNSGARRFIIGLFILLLGLFIGIGFWKGWKAAGILVGYVALSMVFSMWLPDAIPGFGFGFFLVFAYVSSM